jgi:FtsZ-binding cell division protein ZapB
VKDRNDKRITTYKKKLTKFIFLMLQKDPELKKLVDIKDAPKVAPEVAVEPAVAPEVAPEVAVEPAVAPEVAVAPAVAPAPEVAVAPAVAPVIEPIIDTQQQPKRLQELREKQERLNQKKKSLQESQEKLERLKQEEKNLQELRDANAEKLRFLKVKTNALRTNKRKISPGPKLDGKVGGKFRRSKSSKTKHRRK